MAPLLAQFFQIKSRFHEMPLVLFPEKFSQIHRKRLLHHHQKQSLAEMGGYYWTFIQR